VPIVCKWVVVVVVGSNIMLDAFFFGFLPLAVLGADLYLSIRFSSVDTKHAG
jgi:hypothetical protein